MGSVASFQDEQQTFSVVFLCWGPLA